MRPVAGYPLWIGNAGDLRNPRELLNVEIEAVVELADNEPLAFLPRELVRIRFPLSDGGDNPEWLLSMAVNSVAALIAARVRTLVCCSCGLNRSVCIVAAGLARVEGRVVDEILLILAKSGPADVSPRLLSQIQACIFRIQP